MPLFSCVDLVVVVLLLVVEFIRLLAMRIQKVCFKMAFDSRNVCFSPLVRGKMEQNMRKGGAIIWFFCIPASVKLWGLLDRSTIFVYQE